MFIACLDLESTLMPEVWLAVAEHTKINELKITTREEPDVETLMDYRIKILRENNIKLSDLQAVVASLKPLNGAKEFLQWLQSEMPAIILTDALWQTIQPMMDKLGYPTTLSHELIVDKQGFISKTSMRIDDQKTKTIARLKQLNYETIAIGDSFNDLGMLRLADHSIIFDGSDEIKKALPQAKAFDSYHDVKKHIQKIIEIKD